MSEGRLLAKLDWRAVLVLVERHRDEYDAIVDDLNAVTDLGARRNQRAKSRVRGKVP